MAIDPNVRARAYAYFRAFNASHRQARQHLGPLTRGCRDVMRALLWLTGRRSNISYAAIAAEAGCAIATVARALKRLRAAGLITWINRYIWSDRHRKVVRTTNHFSWLYPAIPNAQNDNVILTSGENMLPPQRIAARHGPRNDAGDDLASAIGRFLALKPCGD